MGMGTGPVPWEALTGLPAWQVTEIPRPAGMSGSDEGMARRALALTAAYGCGTPVAVAWIRQSAGGPVRVLTAGGGLRAGVDTGQAVLTIPPGARGAPLADGDLTTALEKVPCWTRIGGITDALLAGDDPATADGPEMVPTLEQGLLAGWLEEFAWLVLAEPVPVKVINDLAFDAAHQQLTNEGFSSPRSKLAARRAGARHEELRQAVTAGLWHVHLLAGGTTPDAAARVARLVCASAGLRGLPYALAPLPAAGSLREAIQLTTKAPGPARHETPGPQPQPADRSWWDTPMGEQPARRPQWPPAGAAGPAQAARQAEDERDTPVAQSPFTASTRLLAALARGPAREVPGLLFTLTPDFDVTPETSIRGADTSGWAGVSAGRVLDGTRIPAGEFLVSPQSLNRHVFVCGATGAGKSQTVRNLLEQASHAGVPWLVIEPAKAEYKLMAARLGPGQVIRIRPGDLDSPPAGINPLEPAILNGTRFPLQAHADLLRELFLAAFQADEPFPQVLAAALLRAYTQAGWNMVTGQPAIHGTHPAYPGLADLQACALEVVEEIGYGREVADNVRGFVTVRIASLRLGTAGRFLDGGHPIDMARLLDANVVFEIEDAGDGRDKAFLIGIMLIRLTEHLRLRHRNEPPGPVRLRHLTVIEEAHRLLRQPPEGTGNGPAAQAVEMFADLLAEVRAYGEGLIIAEQIPAKLIPDAIKNTAVKITHRLPAADDRTAVGATMNLQDHQSEYLVTLQPGEAAVHADGMDYPLLVRMPDGTTRETTTETVTVSPDAVVSVRSPSCTPQCRQHPCTLATISAAQTLLEQDPAITLWAELAVFGYLTGWAPPAPGPDLAARLAAHPADILGCALSHAADAAVTARAIALSSHCTPGELAAHVTSALGAVMAGRQCPAPEVRWLAPPCRHNILAAVLDTYVTTAGPHAPPHPGTGTPVPGDTSGQQLATVRAWKKTAWAKTPPAQRRTLIFGTRTPSAIELAIGGRSATPQWPARAAVALANTFTDGNWALPWITSPTGKG
jgi:hypothetical protein